MMLSSSVTKPSLESLLAEIGNSLCFRNTVACSRLVQHALNVLDGKLAKPRWDYRTLRLIAMSAFASGLGSFQSIQRLIQNIGRDDVAVAEGLSCANDLLRDSQQTSNIRDCPWH